MRNNIVLIVLIASCCTGKKIADQVVPVNYADSGYFPVEVFFPEGMAGCGYMLKSDDMLYNPDNMDDSLKEVGLQLWVKFQLKKETMSVCMMGTNVSITDVKKK